MKALLPFIFLSASAIPSLSFQQEDAAKAPDAASARAISTTVLEKDYGLQIIHIAVTAAGGMIELRFRILDPEKAAQLLKDPDSLPVLMIGDGGPLVSASQRTMRNIKIQKDAVCHILYPNARNAVKAGIPVTAVFGGVRVEPIKAL